MHLTLTPAGELQVVYVHGAAWIATDLRALVEAWAAEATAEQREAMARALGTAAASVLETAADG